MKNNSILMMIVGVLVVIAVGVSFAYFSANVSFRGEGAEVNGSAAEMIKVSYDAGSSVLASNNLMPGDSISKTFKVTVTPGSDTNTATYAIKFNISGNTFEKCTDTNYNATTNTCVKNSQELAYSLKDSSGSVIASGDLTAVTGTITLATETKTVSAATEYSYILEINFADTGADQNHNNNKTITGDIKVEFAE